MEIDARYFGRGATLQLLVRYFNNPRLKRFLSCSRRGAPPGRQPPFGERDVAEDDGIMPFVPAQRLSGPLQPRLRFFPDVTPARPSPSLTGRFPPQQTTMGPVGVTQFHRPIDVNDLGRPFSPTAVPVCRAEIVASRRAASLLGQAFLVAASFRTFRLFSLTRFIRTSHVFAISFRPSLLATLVLAAMTVAFRFRFPIAAQAP